MEFGVEECVENVPMSPGTLSLEGWRWESFFTSRSSCLPCSNEIKMVNFTPFMWSFTPHPVSCAREAQTSRRPSFKATLEWTTQNVCARLTSDAIKYSKSLLSWFFCACSFWMKRWETKIWTINEGNSAKKQWRINSLEMTTRFRLQNREEGWEPFDGPVIVIPSKVICLFKLVLQKKNNSFSKNDKNWSQLKINPSWVSFSTQCYLKLNQKRVNCSKNSRRP